MSQSGKGSIKKRKSEDPKLSSKISKQNLVVTEHTEVNIEWSNLIFLPFHPVFRMFILCSVFIKAILGPIQSVYPVVYCYNVMELYPFTIFIKYCYRYFCDLLYGIDTFLHIAHRQVSDKAVRREHLPKPLLYLACDLVSLIPFFRLVEEDPCPPIKLWPNLLAFNEFVVIYRVIQYFQLISTHSFWKIFFGYTIVMAMCINGVTCLWLLLTAQGFCDRCGEPGVYFDWRAYKMHKLNETDERLSTYVYGAAFVYSFAINFSFDNIKPSAMLEFPVVSVFILFGYLLLYFVVIPKSAAESLLRLRKISLKYPAVQKIIEETKRRNPLSNSHEEVQMYYKLLWSKQSLIISEPNFIYELSRNLRLEIKQDLFWQLFYHSPLLRITSYPFRRWLYEHIIVSYKLPGDIFFTGVDSATTLYYLKSGIVQLISFDDGVTPILSVTSGTIFGDINFLVPHPKRKVIVRCVTYCEIFYIKQKNMLKALHRYPEDRNSILSTANERINHAKLLFNNKQHIRGLDRNEDEGVAWIKMRWWEIFEYVDKWTKNTGLPRERLKNHLPHEHTLYHCAKYIGLLVLCTRTLLKTQSMFIRLTFPWILNPHSTFGFVWHRIVITTVMLVVCVYPSNLIKPEIPSWFIFFSYWCDTIYALDIIVSLFTALKEQSIGTVNFASVLFQRFKSFTFILDFLSAIWIEDLASIVGIPQMYYTLQFNRLIKTYMLFYGDYLKWDIEKDPMIGVIRKIILINITYTVICSHAVFELNWYIPQLTMNYFFGEKLCTKSMKENCTSVNPFAGVTISWEFEWLYAENWPQNLIDIYVAAVLGYFYYLIIVYCKGRFIAYLYLKNRNIEKYHSFVSHLKEYYQHYRIHKDLLKRIDRYLICHWKYYKGTDVMYPNTLGNEPPEVYWKTMGQVAENVIKKSRAFMNADSELLRKLAYAGKFLLMPRNTTVYVFGIQCKNVIWIAQGYIKFEYRNEEGELLTACIGPGTMLSVSAVFFGKASLRTYTTYTECEILYIPLNKFFEIYNSYKYEKSYVDICIKEFGAMFDEMFLNYVMKHKEHQQNVRDSIAVKRKSMISSGIIPDIKQDRSLPFEGEFWGEPESGFLQSWLLFRSITVFVSIASASLLGGIGALSTKVFMMIAAVCDCIAWIDIIMKLFLAYYDKRGLLITDKRKCFINYATKSFILDCIGAFPWYEGLRYMLSQGIGDENCLLMNTVCKFAHIYILFGYFDYIADIPMVNITLIMIIKWQIVNILIVMAVSHYLMVNCVHFEFNGFLLHEIVHRNQCWMPDLYRLPEKLNGDQLHLLFAQSLNLAENGMMGTNFGRFLIDREHLGVGIVLFFLGLIYWFITCYTLTLLVLHGKGYSVFQHGVKQLERFLKSERVDKKIIDTTMDHFKYCWLRTKGVNIRQLANERIGVIFRQDINYFYYKKTLSLLDELLNGGDVMQRHLASAISQTLFRAKQEIFREMDVVPTVCIVHRGKVVISKNGEEIMVLTKGDIFGQLVGSKLRPIQVSAVAHNFVDLLLIDVPVFQDIIDDKVRKTIASNRNTKNNFMASKNIFLENPYDSVRYILRGNKSIMPPWSKNTTEASFGTWYSRWLYLSWFISPILATSLVIMFNILPPNSILWHRIYFILFVTDALHLIHFISEFYTIELVVEKEKCVPRRTGLDQIKKLGFYLDLFSFLIPLITIVTSNWMYQLARMLRLKWLFDFQKVFCRTFTSTVTTIILKFSILLLLLHCFTCGWIYFGCRDKEFPIPITDMRHMNDTIDFNQWSHPSDRGDGCARVTRDIADDYGGETPTFVVPKHWPSDYVVAMTYIIIIQTHTTIDIVIALSLKQVYYKLVITFLMYLLDMWIMAVAINIAYTKYREMYRFDFLVQDLMVYLTNYGLCKSLKDAVLQYTRQVWNRQKGEWFPELVNQAPPCLQQDLFSALYMHHLEVPPTFQALPYYFKRQLAARLGRVVIFPGKCIIREGDTFNTTYFIHEGEVEKWYTDEFGDSQLISVIYTNGYFGCIAGLFPYARYNYSYYARTVVDLVFLHLHNWQDLLEAYPDIKAYLYKATGALKKEYN